MATVQCVEEEATVAHILIIDDDEQILRVLARLIEREGFSVATAADGDAALAAHRTHPADLVITDVILPGKDGVETMLALRKESPRIKILAISGGGRIDAEIYLAAAKRFGADRALTKPIEPRQLVEIIRELLA